MPTYAGIDLVQPTPEICAYIDQRISLTDIYEFERPARLNKLNIRMPYGPTRPVKLGSLYWPVGASQWAVGHFLASESQLASIRAVGAGAQDFTLSDGTNSISPDMFMLPPRPIAQVPQDEASFDKWSLPQTFVNGEPVYLLTLVDERYNWWNVGASITVTEGTTTWTTLLQAIGSALSITLTIDTIAAAYLKPPSALSAFQEYLPLLLDMTAMAIGQRVVRGLDGVVSTQNATTANASVQAQISANRNNRLAGGQFVFDAGE